MAPPMRKRRWTRKKSSTVSNSWGKYLQKIYFDSAHPGSFKGPCKLYDVVTEEGKFFISLPKIKKWLQGRDSYSLHKPIRRKFKRLCIIVTGMNDQYKADLANMQKLKENNDGVAFLLDRGQRMDRGWTEEGNSQVKKYKIILTLLTLNTGHPTMMK